MPDILSFHRLFCDCPHILRTTVIIKWVPLPGRIYVMSEYEITLYVGVIRIMLT
jgi:hypothetical protein